MLLLSVANRIINLVEPPFKINKIRREKQSAQYTEYCPKRRTGIASRTTANQPMKSAHIKTKRRLKMSSHNIEMNSQQLPTSNITYSYRTNEQKKRFMQKLRQCCVLCDFKNPMIDLEGKEIKRAALSDLLMYIIHGYIILTEDVYREIMHMISSNLFRTLPPTEALHPLTDEDDPKVEAAWPHLQLVYHVFLYLLNIDDFKNTKDIIDEKFVLKLLELFDSEDARERNYLKAILRSICVGFPILRKFIREQINNIFLTCIYEAKHFNGLSELLSILGSIIKGFSLPLNPEHKLWLMKVLLPLHKVTYLYLYHTELVYCVEQFLEKDPDLTKPLMCRIMKFWPKTSSQKEMLFLDEIDNILAIIDSVQFVKIQEILFRKIAKCVASGHSQVAERALCLWNNEYTIALIQTNNEIIMPILFPILYAFVIKKHWNQQVTVLAFNVLKSFLEMNSTLFDELTIEYMEKQEKSKQNFMETKKRRNYLKKVRIQYKIDVSSS